jgi:predicted dehydrogenase
MYTNVRMIMIKVGVIGVGYLGQHHARIYSQLPNVELVGVVDINYERAQRIAAQWGCEAYTHYNDILNKVDALSIVVPTSYHYDVAMDALAAHKDILIEKPITSTVHEAEKLIEEAARNERILQVGHLERFNSGLITLSPLVEEPILIESQRLSPFLGRGVDVDVTVDLMVHDIDIILSLVNSEITDLKAQGIKVLTDNIDLAHAWVEFKNGCVAIIVANRISSIKMRSLKVFQHNAFIELDYITHEVSYYAHYKKTVEREIIKAEKEEPLKEELFSFVECIEKREKPVVSGVEGKEALRIAHMISDMIAKGAKK